MRARGRSRSRSRDRRRRSVHLNLLIDGRGVGPKKPHVLGIFLDILGKWLRIHIF